MLINIKWFNSY